MICMHNVSGAVDENKTALVERTLGRLTLELAAAQQALVNAAALNSSIVSSVQKESNARGLALEHLKEDHAALTQWALDQGCMPTEIIRDYKLKPNPRELAMAQTKGEFTQAVTRYGTRTGLTDAQAKEKLKKALGLGATTKK